MQTSFDILQTRTTIIPISVYNIGESNRIRCNCTDEVVHTLIIDASLCRPSSGISHELRSPSQRSLANMKVSILYLSRNSTERLAIHQLGAFDKVTGIQLLRRLEVMVVNYSTIIEDVCLKGPID